MQTRTDINFLLWAHENDLDIVTSRLDWLKILEPKLKEKKKILLIEIKKLKKLKKNITNT